MQKQEATILMSSDTSLTVEWGREIHESVHQAVIAFYDRLMERPVHGIIECVPTYCSVMIHYDPLQILYEELVNQLEGIIKENIIKKQTHCKVIEIPVVYGGEYGPDLQQVALHNQLTIEEVIRRHTSRDYLIYMLGFTPGFAYMGGMDESIATPRLKVPRVKIPAGSVGIAGEQTGIYPIDSPGGWQLIGQTPLSLYNPQSEKPILLEAGQRIRFVPITVEAFKKIKAESTY